MRFRDIAGHAFPVRALQNALRAQRLPHALALLGPAHVGKTTVARAFAAALLCEARTEGVDACGECPPCRRAVAGGHPDLREFRPLLNPSDEERRWEFAPEDFDSGVISVDLMRQLRADALRRPVRGKHKVYLILEAEKMNEEAQNCLLKTLEEPIAGLAIVLVTSNPERLLPTVRSRCWQLPFGFVGTAQLRPYLQERLGLDEATAAAFARAGRGRAGIAIRAAERGESPAGLALAQRIAEELRRGEPAYAFRLAEDAIAGARVAWGEEAGAAVEEMPERFELRTLRTAVAHLLDNLAYVYRPSADEVDPGALKAVERIFETKRQILGNANLPLALDALFLRLLRQARHS